MKPFNTVTLTAGNAYQLTAPEGHYYYQLLNAGTTEVYVSMANTVGSSDPASFGLPQSQTISPLIWGPTGLWVSGAGALSVALVPKQG